MLTLKRIKLINVQSIKDATLDLPEKGIIRFYGENSNGKSIFRKITTDLLFGEVNKPAGRRALINWTCTWCEVEYTRSDGVTLLVHIHLESAQTWYELKELGKEPLRRYLADKELDRLLNRFGWHVVKEDKISLQFTDPDDALLFFKTKHKTNFNILETVRGDSNASRVKERFELVVSDCIKIKHELEKQAAISKAAAGSLQIYNIVEENDKLDRLTYLLSVLSNVVELPNIPLFEYMEHNAVLDIPNLTLLEFEFMRHNMVMDIPDLNIPNFILPDIYDLKLDISDFVEIAEEMELIAKGVCPTCKREF